MPRIKIIKDYQPREGWKVGDVVEVSNAETLVREKNAVLIDELGDEIEHPDTIKQIRRMITTIPAMALVDALILKHPQKDQITKDLLEEGLINRVEEKKAKKEEIKIEDLPVRPSVNVSREQIMAKVEELKKRTEDKI